ncbi:MAG: hypothetical protein L0Y43_10295, partial [Methylococcaceae bacterium]|nr:hypothetical protein [Methylococcaceae bacterium]
GDCRSFDEISEILLDKFAGSAGKKHAARRLDRYPHPLFLVFPVPRAEGSESGVDCFPDADLLDKILQNHPNITPVVSTGPRIPDNLHYLEAVLPEIEAGQEIAQLDLHYDVLEYIRENL